MQDVAIFVSFVTFLLFPCVLAYRSGKKGSTEDTAPVSVPASKQER